MKRLLLSLFLLISTVFSHAESDLLPADKAFVFKAKVVNNQILLNWKIAKNYFLYKEKINISANRPSQLKAANFPTAKIKNDVFFGKVGVYRNDLTVSVPLLKGDTDLIQLTVSYQGCADLGVCYPPITKSVTLDVSKMRKPILPKNALDLLSKTTVNMQSTPNNALFNSADEPLSADQAFTFSLVPLDAKTLLATWNIHQDYYLYHDKFSFDVKGAELGTINLPKGKTKNDPLFGTVQVHKNVVSVEVPLTNIQNKNISLTVTYQGCWEKGICYPPQTKTVDLALPVDSKDTTSTNTADTGINKNQLNETDTIAELLQQNNVLLVLASFFGFGLLLSLTPCVFPMIPILSGIIVGQKEEITTKKALMMSIVFVLAMSVTYSIAGVLAGYFGENLQILFQTPWVLVVFSLVFVVLAFSMFGFYDIQLPVSLQNKISNISNKQGGGRLIGVAIMGFFSALIIGPCIAPPLAGALIYISQTGDAVLGGLSLFVMSLGMGMPLLAVGAGVSKLPKAGSWMDNIKAVFGILMLAVAIYLLDRVISPFASLILWAMLATLSPIAMGTLNTQTNDSTPIQRIFKGLGLLVLAYGILLWGLVARGGGDMLQPLTGWGTATTKSVHVQFQSVKSNLELDKALAKAQNNNQIVMLDFYADWCISCKELERFVFSNIEVVKAMSNVVALQADVTKNDAIDKALMTRFNIIGPPAILFFKAGVENRSQRIVGEINAQDFLKHLNKSK